MPNQYVEFVKTWSKDNGLTYMCSIGDPRLKADYLKFKAGEYEFEITPAPKKKKIEKEFIEIIPAPKKKAESNKLTKIQIQNLNSIKERILKINEKSLDLRTNDILDSPLSETNWNENKNKLINSVEVFMLKLNKLKNGTTKVMSDNLEPILYNLEDKLNSIKLIRYKKKLSQEEIKLRNEISEKTTKENMKKKKDAMVALVEKYAGKLKDLEIKKSDMSLSGFKEQKQNLLEKLDNVIENILNKQETSSEELSDMLGMYIDELTLIYKKVDGLKDPSKKKVEGPKTKAKAKATEESVEEKTQKLIAERVILNEDLKKANLEKDKFLKKMNAIEEPSNDIKNQYMKLIFNYQQINKNLGKIQNKIYELNGRYV